MIWYDPRPAIVIMPPARSANPRPRKMTFIQAVTTLPRSLSDDNLIQIFSTIGEHERGNLRRLFVILNDDDHDRCLELVKCYHEQRRRGGRPVPGPTVSHAGAISGVGLGMDLTGAGQLTSLLKHPPPPPPPIKETDSRRSVEKERERPRSRSRSRSGSKCKDRGGRRSFSPQAQTKVRDSRRSVEKAASKSRSRSRSRSKSRSRSRSKDRGGRRHRHSTPSRSRKRSRRSPSTSSPASSSGSSSDSSRQKRHKRSKNKSKGKKKRS